MAASCLSVGVVATAAALDALSRRLHHMPVAGWRERIQRIETTDDPRIAEYRELREAQLKARHEAFIVESEVALRVQLARGRFPLRSILLAESRVDKLADLLPSVGMEVPMYVAAPELLSAIAGFPMHRGILASAQRTPLPTPAELLHDVCQHAAPPTPIRVVVLEGLTNHDNVGGVLRNAAAFGASAVFYDAATCDPLYRKAIRVSVGAALFVPFARAQNASDVHRALQRANFRSYALSPRADALPITRLHESEPAAQRVALWLGSEGPGLSAAAMNNADRLVRIPIEAEFDSLNVATTSGIALHCIRSLQTGE